MNRSDSHSPLLARLALVAILLISSLGVLPAGLRTVQAQGGDVPEWKNNPPSSIRAEKVPAATQAESFAAPLQATHIYTDSTGLSGLDSFRCPDTATLTMTVPADIPIRDLDVGLNLEHTWRGDLRIWLQSPLGTEVLLVDSDMDDYHDNYDVRLDDESPNVLNDGDDDSVAPPYYDRTAARDEALSAFDGQNALGEWTLSICDMWPGDTGTLNLWTLFFEELPTTAAIGNLVWEDLDTNGLQDPGKPGIEDVTVNLLDGTGAVISTTTTAADGSFLFADLSAGDYALEFEPPSGFLFTLQDEGDDAEDSDADMTTGRTVTTTLEAGEIDLTWDAGLYRPAAMGDFVWEDSNINGIQGAGESGIPDVTVNLYECGGSLMDTTTTGPTGYYSFTNVFPGSYFAEFVLPESYGFSPQDQGGPDADDIDSDADAATGRTACTDLGTGEYDDTWDAGMFLAAEMGDYVWQDMNADGLQNDGATGIADVSVSIYQCGGDLVDSTATNGSGYYEFTGLAPGWYSLTFELPGGYYFSPPDVGGSGADAEDSDADPATGQTDCTNLTQRETDDSWDAGMYRNAQLGNFVWHDLNANGLQIDEVATGLSGVTVTLYSGTGTYITETTTLGGDYTFSDLPPGDYYLEFSPPAGYYFSPQDVGGNDTIDSDPNPETGRTISTTLDSGENDRTWDAGLYQLGTIGDFVWEDLDGDGIQDLSEPGSEPGLAGITVTLSHCTQSISDTAITAPSGYYSFTDVVPGDYSLLFELPDGYAFTLPDEGNDETDSDADPITGQTPCEALTSGDDDDTRDAGAFRGARLGDFVWLDQDADGFQDPDEEGLPGVVVTLTTSLGYYVSATVSSAAGLYEFRDVAPGDYILWFEPPAGYGFSPHVEGDEERNSDVTYPVEGRTDTFGMAYAANDFTRDAGLYPLAELGDLVWEDQDADGFQDDGEPGLVGVTVSVHACSDDTEVGSAVTGSGGLYALTDLPVGEYYLKFEVPAGYALSPQDAGADDKDSDADPSTGRTACTTLTPDETDHTWDAGMYAQQVIYLPLVVNNYSPPLPDLVVVEIIATADDVQVVIENQGGSTAGAEFWVDAYINPSAPPTGVNDTWDDTPGEKGMDWGVTTSLAPGQVITLTRDHPFYHNGDVDWPLAVGTPIYAQVDSAHAESPSYGAVLEDHESTGGPYNNILGPVYVTGAATLRPLPSLGRHLLPYRH
jgi:subtilisin-like proprotein convertase family protein